MLLVCPKCVAQYEVDNQAIPEGGREVQCANCEHIWFQDQLQMFSSKVAVENVMEKVAEKVAEETEIFDDLAGVRDIEFRSAREDNEGSATVEDELNESSDNILADEYNDDQPNDMPQQAVDENVLDVLRSEAAFSSTISDHGKDEIELDVEASLESDADDLTAFLDAHSEEPPEPAAETAEINDDEPDVDADTIEPETEPKPIFDPLADLDAIRSQLDDIGSDSATEAESQSDDEFEYQPILPVDDEIEDSEVLQDDDIAAVMAALEAETPEIEDTIKEGEFDLLSTPEQIDISLDEHEDDSDLEAYSEEIFEDSDDEPEVDDFEYDTPRRAFRADGAGVSAEDYEFGLDEDTEEVSQDFEDDKFASSESAPQLETANEPMDEPAYQSGSAIPAAVALGALRPRTNGNGTKVRSIRGAEDFLVVNEDTEAQPTEASTQPLSRPKRSATSERSSRPGDKLQKPVSRKELLPDVEELNATLRGEESKLLNQNADSIEEDAPAVKSFAKSMAKTLLFLVVMVALYVMRPMIVSAVPAASTVLDPYVGFIDSIRLMIESAIGG